jgi:hypothetical protein
MPRARLLLIALVVLSLLVIPAVASAADVYEGYSRVGSVTASYGGKYDIKQG